MSTTPFTETVADAIEAFDIPVELRTLDNANRLVEARIRRVSPALFELSCTEGLQKGERLALSHEGRRIEVAVSSAVESAAGIYRLAVKVLTEEQGEIRSELRLPTDLSAVLRVAGDTEQIAMKVVDMSPSGMGIEIKVPLPRGAKVCINLEQGLAFGQIRFCRAKAEGLYFAGFLLEEYIGKE